MTRTLSGLSLAVMLLLASVLLANPAAAQTNSNTNNRPDVGPIQEMIKSLLERIKLLQGDGPAIKTEVMETKMEIREYIKNDLRQGTSSDQVKKIQEVLATDSSIYPRGLVTGYFGPLTSEAIKRFQEKFDLEVTGEIDEETREAMNTLLEERFESGAVPAGLLGAPGIMSRFMERLQNGCSEDVRANGPFCLAMKKKHNWEDKVQDEDGDNEDEDEEEDDADLSPRGVLVKKAIDAAADVITELEEAVDEAEDDNEGLDDAEADLADAKTAIEAAEDYLAEERYVSATREALKAKRAAMSGLEALEE